MLLNLILQLLRAYVQKWHFDEWEIILTHSANLHKRIPHTIVGSFKIFSFNVFETWAFLLRSIGPTSWQEYSWKEEGERRDVDESTWISGKDGKLKREVSLVSIKELLLILSISLFFELFFREGVKEIGGCICVLAVEEVCWMELVELTGVENIICGIPLFKFYFKDEITLAEYWKMEGKEVE
jgi:hypothetical protein